MDPLSSGWCAAERVLGFTLASNGDPGNRHRARRGRRRAKDDALAPSVGRQPQFPAAVFACDVSAPVYTTFPPTIVYRTFVPRIESGGTVMMLRDSTTMSASLPGVSEPFSCSSN